MIKWIKLHCMLKTNCWIFIELILYRLLPLAYHTRRPLGSWGPRLKPIKPIGKSDPGHSHTACSQQPCRTKHEKCEKVKRSETRDSDLQILEHDHLLWHKNKTTQQETTKWNNIRLFRFNFVWSKRDNYDVAQTYINYSLRANLHNTLSW